MARSNITNTTSDLVSDDGAVCIPVAHGEQLHFEVTCGWLSDMTGYSIECKVVEGLNDGEGTKPTSVAVTPVTTTIAIIDTVTNDNKFKFVIPANLVAAWDVQPKPDKPVFGFIDIEVRDPGSGSAQQIWKPLRGLIEVGYSPTGA